MKKILQDYKNGKISLSEVLNKLKNLPYEDLGFAKIDNHRLLRKGFPETVFCPGKTIDQIIKIVETMSNKNHNILLTKAEKKVFNALKKKVSWCGI